MSERRADRPATDLAAIISGRRSVRAFLPRPVAHDLIMQALAAASWAPSPHGRQPWRFVVLTKTESKTRLSLAMGDEWRRQLAFDGQSPEIIELRRRKSAARIEQAPVLIIPCLYLADLDQYPDPDRMAAETT